MSFKQASPSIVRHTLQFCFIAIILVQKFWFLVIQFPDYIQLYKIASVLLKYDVKCFSVNKLIFFFHLDYIHLMVIFKYSCRRIYSWTFRINSVNRRGKKSRKREIMKINKQSKLQWTGSIWTFSHSALGIWSALPKINITVIWAGLMVGVIQILNYKGIMVKPSHLLSL